MYVLSLWAETRAPGEKLTHTQRENSSQKGLDPQASSNPEPHRCESAALTTAPVYKSYLV